MISRGENKFCPGCPFTGDFVGPISPTSVDRKSHGYINRLVLIDNDGMESEKIEAHLDNAFDDPLVFEELQSRIVQRVAECVGVVRRSSTAMHTEFTRCPALSGMYTMPRLIDSVKKTTGTNQN